MLSARKLAVPAEVQHRILGCKDLAQLDRWLQRSLEISRIEQLDEAVTSSTKNARR